MVTRIEPLANSSQPNGSVQNPGLNWYRSKLMQTEIFVSLGIAYLLCSEGNIENMCYHTRVCVPGHTSYFQDQKGTSRLDQKH